MRTCWVSSIAHRRTISSNGVYSCDHHLPTGLPGTWCCWATPPIRSCLSWDSAPPWPSRTALCSHARSRRRTYPARCELSSARATIASMTCARAPSSKARSFRPPTPTGTAHAAVRLRSLHGAHSALSLGRAAPRPHQALSRSRMPMLAFSAASHAPSTPAWMRQLCSPAKYSAPTGRPTMSAKRAMSPGAK